MEKTSLTSMRIGESEFELTDSFFVFAKNHLKVDERELTENEIKEVLLFIFKNGEVGEILEP
jgi:hypothetical protein